ncbi:hypothetical protein ACP275_01G114700 [Erythranthe tilingii]
MAFWGIEVKPGKPVTHSCEKARGRLRISLASLGSSGAAKKTIVQCNVGNTTPILLCSLLPNKMETLNVGLEFDEADDVVFSVIGPRSVYLSGYYVLQSQRSNVQSDTESYGVDIENSETDGSNYNSDDGDDKYEDSFIDDDGTQVCPNYHGKGIDEPKRRKGNGEQVKKKWPFVDSDNEANSDEDEDEDEDADAYILSSYSKGAVKASLFESEEDFAKIIVETGDEANVDGACGTESNQKVDPLDINDNLERETKIPLDEEEWVEAKEVETREENIVSNEEVLTGEATLGNSVTNPTMNQNSLMDDEMQSPDLFEICEIPKNKRKRPSDEACQVQTGYEDSTEKEHQFEASSDVETGTNSVDGQKSRKKRNVVECTQGLDEKCQDIPENDNKHDQGLVQHADSVIQKDVPILNVESEEQRSLEETSAECSDIPKEDNLEEGVLRHADIIINDQPAAPNEEFQEQRIDTNAGTSQSEKMTKKKRKKSKTRRDSNTNVTKMTDNEETTNAVSIQKRTLSNGLIIEELASGSRKGKVATPGKKVKFYYTGMVKESGFVFDSYDKRPFKFRLGNEEFIDGWNFGIDGMRVGDKRRLIIPPSLGFGDYRMGENIPPNSWLVYDIELVSVRK